MPCLLLGGVHHGHEELLGEHLLLVGLSGCCQGCCKGGGGLGGGDGGEGFALEADHCDSGQDSGWIDLPKVVRVSRVIVQME